MVYLPPGKNPNRNQFVFLSFWVDPISWQSFIEIGEMACSTTAQCSRGHPLNLLLRNLNMPFSVTGVSETWLTDCTAEFVNTTGYHFVSSHRNRKQAAELKLIYKTAFNTNFSKNANFRIQIKLSHFSWKLLFPT